jgi:hypothetical protein
VNPALPLLVIGHAAGTQAVEVVPRARLERLEARFSARFVPVPKGAPPLTFPDYSRELVAEVERLLERARTGTMALAEEQAATALAQAERQLRAHPELPQAAWLMAERHRLAALLSERTPAPDPGGHSKVPDPRELERRAAALEPERARAFGEAPGSVGTGALTPFRLEVRGVGTEDRLEWDGSELRFPTAVLPGEHHLRVIRGGELVWAGWVTVSPAAPVLRVPTPAALACSQGELGTTRNGAARPLPAPGITCPAWAVLRVDRGRVELSLCRRSACGAWHLDTGPERSAQPPPTLSEPGFPRWATIALASAGAVLFTTVTLWQTGAFDRDGRPTTRWSYEGFVPPADAP